MSNLPVKAEALRKARAVETQAQANLAKWLGSHPEYQTLLNTANAAKEASREALAGFKQELTATAQKQGVKKKGTTELAYGATAKGYKFVYSDDDAASWCAENMNALVTQKAIVDKKSLDSYFKGLHSGDAQLPDFVQAVPAVSIPKELSFVETAPELVLDDVNLEFDPETELPF